MMLGYRSNDAVVTIYQNNIAKTIKISDINKQAEELIGYSAGELVGKSLEKILPGRIAALLKEYVEFEPDANDVGNVLSKVQSFSIVGKDSKEKVYRMKLVRAQSSNETMYFALVLHDTVGQRKNEALRKIIQENLKGHEALEGMTGLPDRGTLIKDIEVVARYCNSSDVLSCFAILQIDQYDELLAKYGNHQATGLLKHIAIIARQSLRPDDVVGHVNHRRIGVLLIDTLPESGRMVFNRLRWQIAANPYSMPDKTPVGISVSIGFCRIGAKIPDKDVFDICEKSLDGLRSEAVNAMVEVSG